MTTETNIINTQITVIECASVADKEGRPQWKVKAEVPILRSRFPIDFYISQADYPGVIQTGSYQILMTRGSLKQGRSADTNWNYYWNLVGFDADPTQATQSIPAPALASAPQGSQAPAQPQGQGPQPQQGQPMGNAPAPVGSGGPQPLQPNQVAAPFDPKGNSIERQVVFKAAVAMAVAQMAIDGDWGNINWNQVVENRCETFWSILQNVGSPPQEPDAPVPAAGPPGNDEGPPPSQPW